MSSILESPWPAHECRVRVGHRVLDRESRGDVPLEREEESERGLWHRRSSA